MSPRKILIVGGGLSAWMTATYLQAVLGHNGNRPVEIEVIESPEDASGDGDEATVPNIRHFLDVVGIDEVELLRKVGGTFRQGTKFVNWLRGSGDFFFHPLDRDRAQPIDRAAMQWLRSNRAIAFAETVSPQAIICDLGLAPRSRDGQPADVQLSYAYHLDLAGFADLLRETAISRGVRQHLGAISNIEMADSGSMKAVSSDNGERLEADLFVDCNGFSTTTPEQQAGTEWVDCSQWLMCDREVVMEVDYAHHYSGRVRPYTTATALSAGWVRENPLQSRRSLCYTYSSRYIDEDSASNELRAFEGRHAKSLETRTASFKVGHRLTPWAGNCVSIGAAASSIESLLSTSLYLSELAAIQLAEHFPTGDDMKPFAYRYNRIVTNRFYEILDGINLHYCLTKREDTEFWREVSKPARINDRLKAKLEFWKHKIPSHADFIDQHFPGQPEALLPASDLPGDHRSPIDTGAFLDLEDYESILYGMQFLADECDDWFGPNRPATKVPRYIIRDLQRAPHSLPPHDVLLKSIAGMPDYPVSSGVRR